MERGAALIEFAFVIVLLVMLVWGIVSFGYAYMLKETENHAAEEGVRKAGLAMSPNNPSFSAATYTSPCTQVQASTPPDPRVDAANCQAYSTLRSLLSDTQITQFVTISSVPGTCTGETGVTCIFTTIKFTNNQSQSNNPIPPALPGISAFMPGSISAGASGKVNP